MNFSSEDNSLFNQPRLLLKDLPSVQGLVFFGVPCDLGASRPGTRFGPSLIRQRSLSFNFRGHKRNSLIDLRHQGDPFERIQAFDLGDLSVKRANLDDWLARVKKLVHCFPETAIPFMLGGDHTFTFSVLEALLEKQSQPFTVVQIDSHLDLQIWGEFNEQGPIELDPPQHSNFLSWILKKNSNVRLCQIGTKAYQSINNPDQSKHIFTYLNRAGVQVTDCELCNSDINDILGKLPYNQDVYLTIDVDAINSQIMMNTGHPSATGMNLSQLIKITQTIISRNRILGIDLMEFGSSHRHEEHSMAAEALCYLILEMIQNISTQKQ